MVSKVKSQSCGLVAESCLTLCDPMDCSLPSSSVHGISQARVLKWVAISFSRDLPNPGIKPVSPALAGRFFTTEPPGKPGDSIIVKNMRNQNKLYTYYFFSLEKHLISHINNTKNKNSTNIHINI